MNNIVLYFYIATTSSALILLKFSSATGAPINYIEGKLSFNINLFTVFGLVLYAASFVAYTYLVSKYDLGYIIPITAAFVYIIVFSASFLFFKEVFTIPKILGITMIIMGLVIINLKK